MYEASRRPARVTLPPSSRGRSGGFDKGRRPVRLLADRAGFWPARNGPMRAAARVPLSNPPRPW
jgi:hypothetical protein